MKKKCLNILVFLMMFFNSENNFSQNNLWYLTRGLSTDEVAWAVDVDSVGNIYWAVGQKDQLPFWYYNILLYKIAPGGQQIWQSDSWDSGTGFNDIAFAAKLSGSNVYLAGRTDSTTNNSLSGDAFVMSYNTDNANLNWAKNITPNPDFGYQEIDGISIQPDGIFLTGWTKEQNTDMDFLIQKIDFSGNTVWLNSWDYNSLGKFDGANGNMVMDANFLYVTGHVNRTNIGSLDGDGALVCFSRINGSYQWNTTWGGSLYDDALGMTMSADSMLYVVGFTGSFGYGSQVYVNKYSRNGELKWSRIWGGASTEDCRSAVADGDSIIYVVGTTGSYGNGSKDILVLKYDSAGTLLDSLLWGGAYDEVAKDVVRYGEYLYITGETKSFGNGQINGDYKTDGLLLKINGRKMLAPDTILTVASETQISKGNFSVYPNPNDGSFQLSVIGYQLSVIEIYNFLGEIVYSNLITDYRLPITTNLNRLNGIYLLKITSDNFSTVQKIVIQK